MVAEPWILRMGNQVSANLKNALLLEPSSGGRRKKPPSPKRKETLGILSFEVASVMSKTVHLYRSLSDPEISKLRRETLRSEGVRRLVSAEDPRLLELAVAEKLEELDRIAAVVSRLGRKCAAPALQGFEHVYGDVVSGAIDVAALGFLVKDMEGMARRMERWVQSTSSLYGDLEVLNEMERGSRKFQQNQHEESRRAFEQKLLWHRQDVSHLKSSSLWGQTFDKVVELLARTVCTIYAKIRVVFGESSLQGHNFGTHEGNSSPLVSNSGFEQKPGLIDAQNRVQNASQQLKRVHSKKGRAYNSEEVDRTVARQRGRTNGKPEFGLQKLDAALYGPDDFSLPCGTVPSRLFLECLTLSNATSKIDVDFVDGDDRNSQMSGCCSTVNHMKREYQSQIGGLFSVGDWRQSKCSSTNSTQFGRKSRLAPYASPSTVGGSALALHYANVIIVIEKLLCYPHLVGEEARDDLYQMLPTSLRKSLRAKLKAYVKNLAIYDAPLAHDWKETLKGILSWLAPLAHNMIRWQSERNFEQQQIVTRTNVVLLQTLYFADREKTEVAICELLVGLNYICRYEHQQNALLDCASSFDFDDCTEWALQQ